MKRLVILSWMALSGNVLAAAQDEIDHLVAYVGSTQCQYERNGDMHNGQQAVEHIQRKADYYANKIETAEDFIRYSATKSAISGRVYRIHCLDQPIISSSEWLMNELVKYRARD